MVVAVGVDQSLYRHAEISGRRPWLSALDHQPGSRSVVLDDSLDITTGDCT
jgi:hypothetical protein